MLGYSKIQIMGNVGNVPEMKYLPSGDQVVNFSVAVNRRYKDRQGNPKEDTDWYRVCAFNGIRTACAQFLSRGSAVFLEGRLQVEPTTRRTANRYPSRSSRPWCGSSDRRAERGCSAAPWAAKIGEARPPPERRNRRRRRRSVLTSLRQAVSSRRRLL